MVGALACAPALPALPGLGPTPTERVFPTAAPTLTPRPPASDTPTPTLEPTPTSTPDVTATAQALAAETQAAAEAVMGAQLEQYGFSTRQGALGWVHDPVTISVTQYQESRVEVDYPDLSVADFVVQADVTWNTSSGLAGCGFALRAEPGLQSNVGYHWFAVRLSGAPQWLFGLFTGGVSGTLVKSGNAPTANDEAGSTNTLAVVGQGPEFSFFVNGSLVGRATNAALTEGVVGFLASHESGRTECTFENAWLWVLAPGGGVQAN